MKLGYACINQTLGKDGNFKTITLKKALTLSQEELYKQLKLISIHNLYNTYKILQWNVNNDIFMYRLTSSMIPLATHSINTWKWWFDEDILIICNKIKNIVVNNDIRISFHPDQFCVLTNFKEDTIFQNSLKDLEYHNILSELLGCETILIHVGGKYNNSQKAKETFIDNYLRLPFNIQNKLHLENDDKTYNVEEVLEICETISRPMILDIHHHNCLHSSKHIDDYIDRIIKTWNNEIPKIHLSTGKLSKTDRSHADYIDINDFIDAVAVTHDEFDIMLESKAKELSILKLKQY
jgi:UV DNA damage endonuclease